MIIKPSVPLLTLLSVASLTALATACGARDGGGASTQAETRTDGFVEFTVPPPPPATTNPPSSVDVSNSSPAPPRSDDIDGLVGRRFDARPSDPNDPTEIAGRMGLPDHYHAYASLTVWADGVSDPVASIQAIARGAPDRQAARIEILSLIGLSFDDPDVDLLGEVLDAIDVPLDVGEELSLSHQGCRDEQDLAAVVIGVIQVGGDAPLAQHPPRAWRVVDGDIREQPADSVVCEMTAGGAPPTLPTDQTVVAGTREQEGGNP